MLLALSVKIRANPWQLLPHFKINSRPRIHLLPRHRHLRHNNARRRGCAGRRLTAKHGRGRFAGDSTPAFAASATARPARHTHIPQPESRILQTPARAAQRLSHKARHHKRLRLGCRRHQKTDLRRHHLRLIRRGTLRQHLIRRNSRLLPLRPWKPHPARAAGYSIPPHARSARSHPESSLASCPNSAPPAPAIRAAPSSPATAVAT